MRRTIEICVAIKNIKELMVALTMLTIGIMLWGGGGGGNGGNAPVVSKAVVSTGVITEFGSDM